MTVDRILVSVNSLPYTGFRMPVTVYRNPANGIRIPANGIRQPDNGQPKVFLKFEAIFAMKSSVNM
jgi:hypothetical protein